MNTKTYRYKPPFSVITKGLVGLLLFIIFRFVVKTPNEPLFRIVLIFIQFNFLGYFIIKLILFLRFSQSINVKISGGLIVIPRRWNKSIHIPFTEIEKPIEHNTRDKVIEIIFKNEVYVVEEKWMELNDFNEVKQTLQNIHTL